MVTLWSAMLIWSAKACMILILRSLMSSVGMFRKKWIVPTTSFAMRRGKTKMVAIPRRFWNVVMVLLSRRGLNMELIDSERKNLFSEMERRERQALGEWSVMFIPMVSM